MSYPSFHLDACEFCGMIPSDEKSGVTSELYKHCKIQGNTISRLRQQVLELKRKNEELKQK